MTSEDKNKASVNEDKASEKVNKPQGEEVEQEKTENNSEKSEPTEDLESGKKKKTSRKKKLTRTDELEEKDKEIEEIRYKMSDINDKYLRLTAEFDNYRKRTLKEKTELIKTAGGDVLVDVLPIVDDFERGLQSMEKAEDIASVKEGVDLIYNKFRDFLKVKGINEIEALNKEFDTDFHEALTKIPAPEENLKGKVVDVIQKGYKIGDKVIRFAKVVVGE